MREITYPTFVLGNTLTEEQLKCFEEFGFLHFKGFLSKDQVANVLKATQEIQAKWIADNVEKINGVPIKYGFDIDGSKIVQRFAFSSLHHPYLHEILSNPQLKSLFGLLEGAPSPRIGENEKDGLVINHYINTPNSKFSQMGWHTDALRDVFYGKKIMPMLNVGIHLDNSSPAKGGLRLIPGTHKQSLKNLLFRKKYFLDHEPDAEEVGLTVEAGDLTVHDGRLWHRVAVSPIIGEESRRRVMYVPFITGKYKPKNENSKTRLYQRFMHLLK
jgi:phytanoyl-CoA hydroxylase